MTTTDALRARDLEQYAIDQRRLAERLKHLDAPALSMRASALAQEAELIVKKMRNAD